MRAPVHDGLSVYLQEAGRTPLLDPETEARLARELAEGRSRLRGIAQRLPRKLGREATDGIACRPRPGEEWTLDQLDRFCRDLLAVCDGRRDTVAAALARDVRRHKRQVDHCRERLTLANLRLVVHIARKYTQSDLSLIDRIQDGNLGLLRAIERFDHARGNRFSTYAYWWIKQAIERAISNQGRSVRVPVHVQEKAREIRNVGALLRSRLGREPTTGEIASEMDETVAKVQEVRRFVRSTDPLEDPDQAMDHLRRAPDPSAPDPYGRAADLQTRRGVEAVLDTLSEREAEVLRLRFGLGRASRNTLKSVGDAMQLSRERVRQIEQRAFDKIRANPLSDELARLAREG